MGSRQLALVRLVRKAFYQTTFEHFIYNRSDAKPDKSLSPRRIALQGGPWLPHLSKSPHPCSPLSCRNIFRSWPRGLQINTKFRGIVDQRHSNRSLLLTPSNKEEQIRGVRLFNFILHGFLVGALPYHPLLKRPWCTSRSKPEPG